MDYNQTIQKTFGFNLLALFKVEYSKEVGKFDAERYSRALENFKETINDVEIAPPEEFIMMGIENLHLLDKKTKRMLKYIVRRGREIETESFPNMIRQLLYGIVELQKDPEIKGLIIQMQQQQQEQLPQKIVGERTTTS